jgi:uncharacterized protein YjiS (DUF1127 family)
MVITLIALRSLWLVWSERQRQRNLLAQMTFRELADIGITDAERQFELAAPFWRAVFARHRRDASFSRNRREQSRKAISRLSRMARRRLEAARRLEHA